MKKINLASKYKKITEHWSPKVVAEMNNYQFKLAKIKNDFIYDVFISEFDQNYDLVKNYKSSKVNIKNKEWKIYQPIIFENNNK